MFKSLFCKHQWKTIEEYGIYTNKNLQYPIGLCYVQQCNKCGKIEFRKIKIK